MIITQTLMLAGNLIVGFGTSFPVMMVGRALNGFASGAYFIDIPTYICEITQPGMRQFSLAISMVYGTGGISLSYIIGAVLPWRHTVMVMAGIIVVTVIGMITVCPESPSWYVSKNHK